MMNIYVGALQRKKSVWQAIANKRMLICIFNGFTAGLPLYYIYQFIPAWLRSEQIDLKTIGLFALVGIPYNWKFVWSPMMDRYVPPFLGRRRGWMLMTQVALLGSMFFLGSFDPKQNIWVIAYLTTAIAFFSASQDIALDAYRRELLPDEELGLGNSMYANAYRISGFVPGGLGLILADHLPWSVVHMIIALFMFVGIIKTLLIAETATDVTPPKSIREAIVLPFSELGNDYAQGNRFCRCNRSDE